MLNQQDLKEIEIQENIKLINMQWHLVKSNTAGLMFVCPVIGGWLVKEVQNVITPTERSSFNTGYSYTSSMVFVPDPNHEWFY
jgi:hypothetical protein